MIKIPSTQVVGANVHAGVDSLAGLEDWADTVEGRGPLAHGAHNGILQGTTRKVEIIFYASVT